MLDIRESETPDLIAELKSQHVAIAEILYEVKTLGISSNEGCKKLLTVKGLLQAHLGLEDQKLYPVLRRAAESDANLQKTLNTYAHDMGKISGAVVDFFEKYDADRHSWKLDRDFKKLFSSLILRIGREETTLYQIYEEVV